MDDLVIELAGRTIGAGHPCFIIAEAGVNHDGSVKRAVRLIDAAVEAKADAVKFQTFRAERLVSALAPKAAYQRDAATAHESQLEMIRRLELPPEAFRELRDHCRQRDITFLSTPFDEQSADLLETLQVPAFKISSGDVTAWPLLEHVARKGRPVILSTGMATMDEVADAVRVIRAAGGRKLALLHCVSRYPADPADANLRAMRTMQEAFGVPAGYSDHTLGIETSLAAVALGACIIEKHLTLDRTLPGPDHGASADPETFAALVRGIRTVERALGDGRKHPVEAEADTAAAARKSLIAQRHIPAGSRLTEQAIAIQRPGTGLPPSARPQLVGKAARRDIPAGTVLTWDLVE